MKPTASRQWIPYFVLGVSLLLTAAATYYVAVTAYSRDRLRFQAQVLRTEVGIQNRMGTYLALLRATSGLFAAEESVSREQFHDFIATLDLRRSYPGLLGIGFVRRVLPGERQAVVEEARAEGIDGFHLWPTPDGPESQVILYLEPQGRRSRVLGLDMSAEPVRRAAMERARDTGLPAATPRITLIRESRPERQSGFLVFLPIYRSGAPLRTVAERRAALRGFVYSPFRANDLLAGIFGRGVSPTLSFEIQAGERVPGLLYRSHPLVAGTYRPRFTVTRNLKMAGIPWSIDYSTLPPFEEASGKGHAALLLVLGLFASGVLFSVAQGQVQAREEAEAANQAKDRFMAALSHELRTPLTPVLAVLSGTESDPGLPADVRDRLGMVRRNVELEARLIDDLLDITRITQGKLELLPRTSDLRQILEHAIETCWAQVPPASRPHLEPDFAPVDHRLWADAPRLTQVFWNLLSNALKFTPATGTIRVRTSHDAAGDRLVVEVSDTGLGIERDRLPHIFDAFVQGENRFARQFGGLGLGLAISKTLVELHGGTLTAESAGRGQGSTFTVRLPVGDLMDQTASLLTPLGRSTLAPEPNRTPLHILLVEDHPDTADAMATLLRGTGRKVTVAHSVAAALDAARAACGNGTQERIDLVVSDLGLPDGSGLELMSELSDRYGLRGIALSGFGMDEDLRKSHEAGFSQHLTKPVTLQTLEAAIVKVAAG